MFICRPTLSTLTHLDNSAMNYLYTTKDTDVLGTADNRSVRLSTLVDGVFLPLFFEGSSIFLFSLPFFASFPKIRRPAFSSPSCTSTTLFCSIVLLLSHSYSDTRLPSRYL